MRLLFVFFLSPYLLFAQTSLLPTHFYSLDGNVKDTGIEALHGENHGVAFDSGFTEKPFTGAAFTEIDQYISLPVNLNLKNKGMTLSFWVYPEKQAKPTVLFTQKEDIESPGWQVALKSFYGKSIFLWDFPTSGFRDDKLHFRGYSRQKWGRAFETWYQISMTFSPDDKIRFYLDGILVHESKNLERMGSFETEAPIIVGNHPRNTLSKTYVPFKGKIDNISLFDFALEPEEIEEYYFQQAPNLHMKWGLVSEFIREQMRRNIYTRNRKEGKPDNECFFTNMANRIHMGDRRISQFIGVRQFDTKEPKLSYDEHTQKLHIEFPGFDTLAFHNIHPEDFSLEEFKLENLEFINTKFEPLGSDSLHFSYQEIHNPRTGKRYVSESKLSYETFKTYVPTIKNITDNLEFGFPVEHLHVPLPNIYFETGKDSLLKASYTSLNRVVLLLNQYPEINIDISGHTDNKGDFQQNLNLSTARAKAVRDYLIKKGIEIKRLKYGGYGSSKPSVSNDTSAGRKQNRRVEIQVTSDVKASLDKKLIR